MKKFLALLLALVMVFALAACGSEPAESEDGTHARGAPNGAANEVMCAPGIQRVGGTGDKA